MTITTAPDIPAPPTRAARLRHLLSLPFFWWERRKQRQALLEMTDEQLADIGITAHQAYREGIRPFWQ